MTFFVDANAIILSARGDEVGDRCLRVLEEIGAGEVDGRTSSLVLEEVWHVTAWRLRHYEKLAASALTVFSPLLPVTEKALAHAFTLGESGLGAADRIHVGTCRSEGIDVVLSADRDFDEIGGIERVDPLDPDAVERLLG